MARHEYSSSDGAYSAEVHRLRMEQLRREEERRAAMKEVNEYRKPVEKAIHTAEHMLERTVRKSITSDPIANEFRNACIYGGFVSAIAGGIALSVAAAAHDAAHNRALERAQDDLTRQQHEDFDKIYEAEKQKDLDRPQTLAEYKQDVIEQREMLSLNKDTYYNEYKETRADAQQNIDSAQKDYDRKMQDCQREEARLDKETKDRYAQADAAYSERMSRIDSLPESQREAARTEARRERDDSYNEIRQSHYDGLSDIGKQRDAALETRDALVKSEQMRIDEAKTTFVNEVREQKRELSNAEAHLADLQVNERDALSRTVAETKLQDGYGSKYDRQRNLSDEQLALIDKVEADDINRKLARKEGTEYTPMVTPEERAQAKELERNHRYGETDRASAYDFATSVQKTHDNVGHSLAAALATGKDKELLDRVAADDRSRKDYEKASAIHEEKLKESNAEIKSVKHELKLAEKNGDVEGAAKLQKNLDALNKSNAELKQNAPTYTPTVNNAERAQAKALEKQYAGNISSEKDIKKTINNLKNDVSIIDGKINDSKDLIKKNKEQIDKLNPEIAAKKAELAAAKASGGSTVQIQKDLNILNQKKNGLNNEIKNANKQIDQLGSTKRQAEAHIGMLGRNSKAIADTTFDITKHNTFTGALGGLIKDKSDKAGRAISNKTNSALMNLGNKMRDNHGGLIAAAGAGMAHVSRRNLEKNIHRTDQKAQSKKGNAASKKASQMLKKSMGSIQREANKAIHGGNAIHKEMFGTARKMARVAQKYELALSVAAISLKVMKMPAALSLKCGGKAFRHIGGKTRLADKWAKSKLGKGLKQFGNRVDLFKNNHKGLMTAAHLGKLGVKGAGKSLIHMPTKILKAPKAIIGTLTDPTILAKKAAMGAFRVTRKTTGLALKGAKGAARLGGKAGRKLFQKTIGKSKLYNKFQRKRLLKKQMWKKRRSDLAAKFRSTRFGSFLSNLFGGARGGLLNIKKYLKLLYSKIATALSSAFSSIMSFVMTALGYVLLGVVAFLLIFICALVVLGGLASLLEALAGFFKSANKDALVSSDPAYMLRMAVQYRDAELEILDVMNSAQNKNYKLAVSADPIYYLITEEGDNAGQTPPSFGAATKNPHASSILTSIVNAHNKDFYSGDKLVKKWTYTGITEIDTTFKVDEATYDTIKLQYYESKYVKKDSNGRLTKTLLPGAVPSSYEISNAKDALCITDAIYTNRPDTMDKMEVLAYLGVGATQIADFDDDKKRGESLFWNSHTFIYRSGDSSSDIWYHATEASGNNYLVTNGKKYTGSSGTTAISGRNCNKKETKTLTYDEVIYTYTKKHTSMNNFTSDAYSSTCKEYVATNAINKKTNSDSKWVTPGDMYYQSGGKTQHTLTVNGSSVTTNIYVVKTNSSKANDVVSLRKTTDGSCDRLYFYKADGWDNVFVVCDKNNKVVDYIWLNTNSGIYKLVRNVSVNPSDSGKTTIINESDTFSNGCLRLDYFWIDWDASAKAYTFKVTSFVEASNYANEAQTKEYMQSQLKYGYNNAKYPNYIDGITTSKITVTCTHDVPNESDPVEKTIKYEVCKGHIDLDVAVGVIAGCTDLDGNENQDMFTAAMYVNKLDHEIKDSDWLGIYSSDDLTETEGWGSISWHKFDPQSDWKAGTDYRTAAMVKSDNELTYSAGDSTVDCDNIKHIYAYESKDVYKTSDFKPLAKCPGDNVGFGFRCNGKTYYQTSMISGEQRLIKCYKKTDDGLKPVTIDIVVSSTGAISFREN